MSFRHEYRIALETVASLARAEGGTTPSGAAGETQVARSIGAILARAGGKASVVARSGILEIGWTPSPEDAEPLGVATAASSVSIAAGSSSRSLSAMPRL